MTSVQDEYRLCNMNDKKTEQINMRCTAREKRAFTRLALASDTTRNELFSLWIRRNAMRKGLWEDEQNENGEWVCTKK